MAAIPGAAAAAAANVSVPTIPISRTQPKIHPTLFKGTQAPMPTITLQMVLAQLQGIVNQSEQILNLFNLFVFINPTTSTPLVLNIFHYSQYLCLFDLIIDHLSNPIYHPGGNYGPSHKHYALHDLYYDWEEEYGQFYAPSYREKAFKKILGDFLNLVDLPMCALRIVGQPKGKFIFHGKIKRNGVTSTTLSTPQNFTEEFACRLFGIAIPDYMVTLEFKPAPNHNVDHLLLVEKNCHMNSMNGRDFHRHNNVFIMSGSGYPDTLSRAGVKYMSLYFNKDVHALCDYNPDGVKLMNSYFHVDDPILSHLVYRTRVRWLGCNPFFMNCFNNLVYNPANAYTAHDDSVIRYLLDPNREFCDNTTPEGRRRINYLNRMASSCKMNLSVLPGGHHDAIVMHFLNNNWSA